MRVIIAAKLTINALKNNKTRESLSKFLNLSKKIRKDIISNKNIAQGWVSKLAPEMPTWGKKETR